LLFFCIHAEYFFFQVTGCLALTFLDDMWFKFTISIPGNSQFYFAHAGYNRFLHVPISAICCFFVLVIIFCVPIFCIWTANISFIISSNSLHFLGWYILIIRKAHVHFQDPLFLMPFTSVGFVSYFMPTSGLHSLQDRFFPISPTVWSFFPIPENQSKRSATLRKKSKVSELFSHISWIKVFQI